jgi:hypothetical protein
VNVTKDFNLPIEYVCLRSVPNFCPASQAVVRKIFRF